MGEKGELGKRREKLNETASYFISDHRTIARYYDVERPNQNKEPIVLGAVQTHHETSPPPKLEV